MAGEDEEDDPPALRFGAAGEDEEECLSCEKDLICFRRGKSRGCGDRCVTRRDKA